jgi:hypothetical protein
MSEANRRVFTSRPARLAFKLNAGLRNVPPYQDLLFVEFRIPENSHRNKGLTWRSILRGTRAVAVRKHSLVENDVCISESQCTLDHSRQEPGSCEMGRRTSSFGMAPAAVEARTYEPSAAQRYNMNMGTAPRGPICSAI